MIDAVVEAAELLELAGGGRWMLRQPAPQHGRAQGAVLGDELLQAVAARQPFGGMRASSVIDVGWLVKPRTWTGAAIRISG